MQASDGTLMRAPGVILRAKDGLDELRKPLAEKQRKILSPKFHVSKNAPKRNLAGASKEITHA